jgi:PTS system nitrogen regulatory IIA component
LQGDTKEAVIEELLAVLVRNEAVRDAAAARDAVWTREKSMSTGMQYGIAIPHGRTDGVDQLVCAVGLKREGVEFDSIDGQPARIIVLTLSPKAAAAPHVQFMSSISQVLGGEGREALLACRTATGMYNVLAGTALSAAVSKEPAAEAAPGQRGGLGARLSAFLKPELMTVDLRGVTREEVIDELLRVADHEGLVCGVDSARDAVLERERLMPTGMGHGIAIPHARTDSVGELVCVVGLHRRGVNFGGPDNEPATIIILTLSPTAATVPHVQLMAMLSRRLDEAGRRRASAARTTRELWEFLTSD